MNYKPFRSLIPLGIVIWIGLMPPVSAQTTITVNGTMTDLDPDHNFTASQNIVLRFTLNDSGSPGGTAVVNNYYHWVEESSVAVAVFRDFTGDAFSGSWIRSVTPTSYVTIYESGQLYLQIGTALASNPMGISVNGRAIYSIVANVVLDGFTPSVEGSLPDLSSTLGTFATNTYSASSSPLSYIRTNNEVTVDTSNFVVNSVTISAVPEPATYALLLGFVILGVVASRRRKMA